jgi:hypothetical protein
MGSLLNARLIGKIDVVGMGRALEKKDKKVLFKSAAFARTVMKRGMRRSKKVSRAGGYPAAHAGQLRDLIFFDVDVAAGSVGVGPLKFDSGEKDAGSAGTIPRLINEGGRVSREVGPKGNRRIVSMVYKPRPFVELTLPKAAAKMAELYETIPLVK